MKHIIKKSLVVSSVLLVAVFLLIFISPQKAYADPSYSIGGTGPAGGIIFYINGSFHAEAGPVDLGSSIWTSAAALCADYVSPSGHDDWILPTQSRLNQMYLNLGANGLGGFATNTGYYWSSTSYNQDLAYAQHLTIGLLGAFPKIDFFARVRPIRTFYTTSPTTYTVTFDKNGGDTDATPLTSSGIVTGGTATLPTTQPTWAGHTFGGWNTQADGLGTMFTASTPVTEDITVYASYAPVTANITVYASYEYISAPETGTEPKPWVRDVEMTCWQVYINEDNNFEFIFWWLYGSNNWVKIYDMEDNLVFEKDLEYGEPVIEVALPEGFYTVRTYHTSEEPLQEFLIGKP